MSVTVTPCTSTITATSTVTSTSTVNDFPMKRHAVAPAALEVRQGSACAFTTNSPTHLPTYVTTACTSSASLAPAARYSSACSCNGITAVTTTIATPLTTVTATSTVTTTVTPTPQAFILQSSGDPSLYVSLDGNNALVLTTDTSVAAPFYVDNSGNLRNLNAPDQLLVDYYIPNSGTANDQIFAAVPSGSNFAITCSNRGNSVGAYYGNCQSSGPPDGNPVVYGFGTCPNEGHFVYLIPNNSNVKCYDGGYAFLGFFLQAYTH